VWLVELAPLADPALVPQAVATVLGVKEQAGQALQATLMETLRRKGLLLLLDNCEHLLDACARLADALLRSCSGVRILATSREALGIAGEAAYRVPSLSLPAPGAMMTAEGLALFDAIRLFTERAAAARSGFALTAQNAAAVVHVCRRLDGIPLALELAAARLMALSAEQLAARLDQCFRLLTGGSRTALPRQQTLRATVDWSYDLLAERERRLFPRLAVFVDGWTLEAAEQVCAGDGIEPDEVLDLLTRLIEQSLVLAEEGEGGTTRYRLLEVLRQFGREKLAASGEAGALYERHAVFYQALGEEAEPYLLTPDANVWQRRLQAEHDNVRAVLQHWLDRGQATQGLRLAVALRHYWYVRGYFAEAYGWVRDLLALSAARGETPLRATGLFSLAQWAGELGEAAAAEAAAREGTAIYRALGDAGGIAVGLHQLGFIAWEHGEYDQARRLMEESLAISRRLGDTARVTSTLCWLGRATNYAGQPVMARRYLEEGLALATQLEHRRMVAANTEFLGEVAAFIGDDREAGTRFAAALALYEAFGDKPGIGTVNTYLGRIALQRGDVEGARRRFRTGLRLAQEIGYRKRLCDALEGLAALAATEGHAEYAYRLIGAAAALRESSREPAAPHERAWLERQLAPARAALGDRAAMAQAEGRALTPEDAVAYALEAPATTVNPSP